MSVLEWLGLSKKNSGAPVIGRNKKKQEASSLNHNMYVRAAIIVGFLAILFSTVSQPTFQEKTNYSIGEPWKADDLTAPFTFAIQKSEAEIEQEQETIRQNTPPVYYRQEDSGMAAATSIDSVFQNLQPVFSAYGKWQSGNTKSTADSLAFAQAKNAANANISEAAWQALLQNYRLTSVEGQQAPTKTARGNVFIGNDVHETLNAVIQQLYEEGVINQPKQQLDNNKITVRNLRAHTEQTLSAANVRDIQQASQFAQYRLSQRYNDDIRNAAIDLFNQVIKPNLIFQPQASAERVDEAIADISDTKGAVAQGQVIIRKGDLITQERLNVLQSLAQARSQKASTTEQWVQYIGHVLVIFSITVIFFFYLYLYRRHIFKNNTKLLLVLLVMSVICVSSTLVYQFADLSLYIVPVAIAPIILTIIFDSRVGILSAITLALLTALINGNNFEFATATIVACCLGLFSVRDIKKRSQFFFTTPGIVFLSYAVVIVGFSMTVLQGWDDLLGKLVPALINAIFILFTYPLILLIEKTFKITTDLTLIELSDTNLPLLKELMNKAPGTFHHSLQVANLSEAAAGAIRANGLLCRTAALYHDIGKMENPAYFAENQVAVNEHDKLKPRMSALVIKAHVSNGVKIAEKHKLPELVINFIRTHHGTSVIKFFYEKAKEECDEDKDEVMKEDFRYDGPRPNTKETGILLLADGIEAASRAMKDPNYTKLQNLVNKMVDARVNDGQLSNTPLTFQDLSVIKETFLNILMGIYHSRVEYPDDEKDGDATPSPRENQQNHKNKSPKTSPSEKDGSDHSNKKWGNRSGASVSEYYNS